MKISFVVAPIMDKIDEHLFPIAMDRVKTCPPYGVYLLHRIVREAGFDADICDMICEGQIIEARLQELAVESAVVAISTTSLNWPTVLEIIRAIRRYSQSVRILLGGVHATRYYRYILTNFPVDHVLRGEADRSIVAYMEYIHGKRAVSEVPGLCYLDGQTLVKNRGPALIDARAMGTLPLPSYDLIPPRNYEALAVESSRGCQFNCSFCATVSRGNWRALDAELFIDRLKSLEGYVSRTLNPVYQIIDDCFTLDVSRAVEILDLWKQENIKQKATLDARVDNLRDARLVASLCGVLDQLLVGAECGYEEGLAKVRKGTTLQDIERSASILKDHGISQACVYSFIIGFPWETLDDCVSTIAFATDLKHRYDVRVYLQWFCTIPGSALWTRLRAENRVSISQYDEFGFFRNHSLFYAGVRLSPSEIDDINKRVRAINKLLVLTKGNGDIIQYSDPMATLDEPNCIPRLAHSAPP